MVPCHVCGTWAYSAGGAISPAPRSTHGAAPAKSLARQAAKFAACSGAEQNRVSAWSNVGAGPLKGFNAKSGRPSLATSRMATVAGSSA